MGLDRDTHMKAKYHGVPGRNVPFGRGGRCRCHYNRCFQVIRISSSLSAAYETGGQGRGFEGSLLGKGISCSSYTKGKSRRGTIQKSQSNLMFASREDFGPTTVSSVRK